MLICELSRFRSNTPIQLSRQAVRPRPGLHSLSVALTLALLVFALDSRDGALAASDWKPVPSRDIAASFAGHELGDGTTAIERDFGGVDRWCTQFIAMGKALGGGSGWVLLTYSPRDKRLANQWASDHAHSLAGATPILALDMYEHSYHMDYGAKAAAYVDAFMQNIDWAKVAARFASVCGRNP